MSRESGRGYFNEFDLRPEVIFIQYDGVLKDSNQFIINKLGGELYKSYSKYMDIDKLKGIDMYRSMMVSLQLVTKNPFEVFAKGNLNFIDTYNTVYEHYDDMFKSAHPLKIYADMQILLNQKFTQEVYVYHPTDDPRITTDVYSFLGNNSKLTYVFGNIDEVLKNIPKKITTFMISDISLVPHLSKYDKLNYTDITVAQYRRNYFLNNGNVVMMQDITDFIDSEKISVRQSLFIPVDLDERHFN